MSSFTTKQLYLEYDTYELTASQDDITDLPPEIEQGNIEYKLHLKNPSLERIQHLITQLKWRLAEGFGEAMYEIGVSDKGRLVGLEKEDLDDSISTLRLMAKDLNADCSIVREQVVSLPEEPERKICEVMVRYAPETPHFLEIRIAIIGGAEVGKSTFIGVLCQGDLDNGYGKTRLTMVCISLLSNFCYGKNHLPRHSSHRHEIKSGRTSSISRNIVGFDPLGKMINYSSTNVRSWEQIIQLSSKVITFMDMCGHPKYQRTTVSGLAGTSPDYACLLINANAGGLSEVTKEHLDLVIALRVPIAIIITKIDIATQDQLRKTLSILFKLLKSPSYKKLPVIMESQDDIVVSVSNFITSNLIPVFLTSSVKGDHIDFFSKFLNLLPKPFNHDDLLSEKEVEYQIEEMYSVPGVGQVLGGILSQGRIPLAGSKRADTYYLGPDNGRFVPVQIVSMHRQRCLVNYIKAGQAATCAIKFLTITNRTDSAEKKRKRIPSPLKDFHIRRGQVLLKHFPTIKSDWCGAVWEFTAQIHLLSGSLGKDLRMMVYAGSFSQTCVLIDAPNEPLKVGEFGTFVLRFTVEPEWLRKGWTVLIRELKTRAIGKISGLSQQ